jgi:hypothetical protein
LPPKPPETKEAAAHAETEVVESGNNRNTESIFSGGLHMSLYSKIWRFGVKIHLQQGL